MSALSEDNNDNGVNPALMNRHRHVLPSVHQTWAHSTVSQTLLAKVLQNSKAAASTDSTATKTESKDFVNENSSAHVTAIETDLLMGYHHQQKVPSTSHHGYDTDESMKTSTVAATATDRKVPIMAHPPDDSSDLSVHDFLVAVTDTHHHLKLDFKETAVVQPSLQLVREVLFSSKDNNGSNNGTPLRTIFLNADILPGPGRGPEDMTLTAQEFMTTTCQLLLSKPAPSGFGVAYSLGWKVDVCWPFGYTKEHVDDMEEVLQEYIHDIDPIPIVLAVNARLLLKSSPQPFWDFLQTRRNRQLLVWTGSGEPPIGSGTLRQLQGLYGNVADQVGYDVQVTTKWHEAVLYDTAMYAIGCKNLFLRWKHSLDPTTVHLLRFSTVALTAAFAAGMI